MDLPTVVVPDHMLRGTEPDLIATSRAHLVLAIGDALAEQEIAAGIPEWLARPITVGQYRAAARARGDDPADIDRHVAAGLAYLGELIEAAAEQD